MPSSATDIRITVPGEAPALVGGVVIIQIPKATLVMSRRAFLESLQAGKRWKRREALQTRVAKAQEERCQHPD